MVVIPVMQLAEAMAKEVLVFVTVEALTVKVPPRFIHPETLNLIWKYSENRRGVINRMREDEVLGRIINGCSVCRKDR